MWMLQGSKNRRSLRGKVSDLDSRGGFLPWQANRKAAADALDRGHTDDAAVAVDDPLGDSEPQARTLCTDIARVVGTVEPLERVSCGFLVHADTLVLNTYVDRAHARIGCYAKCDGRSRTRVLGGAVSYTHLDVYKRQMYAMDPAST